MSSIFGGSQSESSSTAKDYTPSYFKKTGKDLSSILSKFFGGGGQASLSGVPSYSGPMTAKIGAGEQDMLDRIGAHFGSASGIGAASQGYLGDVIGGKYLPGGEEENPFLQAAIKSAQRPTLQGLEELMTRINPGKFTSAGHFAQPGGSSAFDRAQGIGVRGAADAMGDIATNMSSGAYETERGRQQEAIGMGAQQLQSMAASLEAQALPRLIEEYGIQGAKDQFSQRLDAILKALGVAGGVSVPTIASNSSSSSSSTGGLASLFSSLFSKGV